MFIFAILVAAGCAENEDLVVRYGLEDTRGLLIVHCPQYRNTKIDLRNLPRGTGHWVRGKAMELALFSLRRISLEEQPPEAEPAFALVFFSEDDVSYRTLLLDQYLNVLPGFQFLGESYGGPYCETPRELKWILLELIWKSPRSQAYHVSLLTTKEAE